MGFRGCLAREPKIIYHEGHEGSQRKALPESSFVRLRDLRG
jgi:hypothetical protein